ncbi:MAG: helix-turn-helix transcriptional regulator [Bacteroidia bacterium]|nr:helix-turn-helix transcriptional regulator [Bacteroidia bacterium]
MQTQKKSVKRQTKSLEELEDKYFGKKGSQEREVYESQVRLEIIGELLKQMREDNNLTQSQLAKKLGMHKAYVSKIENNVKTQRLDTILKLMKVLKGHLFIRLSDKEGTREVELV